ncbi:uncharacterized protein SPAPADRAFT_62555 [Spathaspora passalidarum NRRL Y-27907]|uniref:Uncharacterized protein n=1 Tax=Spathaspora passalidarum (strain NRRL Y-27907 / 11-Y1) TaxID=619300 RepID=G3ASK1_SPAPN|nr:uncharacterized protein SPAPADRAFT_62555 [Spathaspora passalidarum NRRL Y-27907]EGW30687.1 hypothetical protein SPAPADRAFT_62555 [Spathaspora passalidarum NRRL Y-27907]
MSFNIHEDTFDDCVSYVESGRVHENSDFNNRTFSAVKRELLSYFDNRTTLWMNLRRGADNDSDRITDFDLFPAKSLTQNNFNPIVETTSTKIPYKRNCTVPIEPQPRSDSFQQDQESNTPINKSNKLQRFLSKLNKRQFSPFKKHKSTSHTSHRLSLSFRRSWSKRKTKSPLILASQAMEEITSDQSSSFRDEALPKFSQAQSPIEFSLFSPPPPKQRDASLDAQLVLPTPQLPASGISRFNFDLTSFFNGYFFSDAKPAVEYSESQITKGSLDGQ